MELPGDHDVTDASARVLAGGGELGARMRGRDWSETPLGAVETWPQSLKTAVRIMLTSRQPMFVWWGEHLINLYNDAYKSIVGGKHPEAFGQPAAEVWREIWDQVRPRAESAMRRNEGTYDEALLLIMERNGYPEETYYTFSYSPVPNDGGGVGGIICANTDDTQRIVGERQLALLRDLAARTADARTFDEACTLSANCLGTNRYDLPFAMIYLVDPEHQQAELAGVSGIERGHPAAPDVLPLHGDATWPIGEAIAAGAPVVVRAIDARFAALPGGAWQRPPHQAAVVPIAPSGPTGRTGILVVGLSPFRLFDDAYCGFLELVAAQVAASLANAQAYAEERQRAEALAELDRAKTAFFSNISHEFRTPLTLMLGPLEDLLNHPHEAAPGERDQLLVIHRNAARLLKLVNTLLDFSRIEAGRIQATYEPTDLAALTAELASVFRSAIERAGMALVVDCPPLAEPIYVDRGMWEKIVFNLLSNAFKFTFAGTITVRLRPAGDLAELSVEDTGTGIPADEIPRLFERFHRVSGARGRTFEGTGIGLALVQELTRLHGGTVRVDSEVDRGSVFTVTIPRGTAHLPPARIGAISTLTSTDIQGQAYVEEALRWLPDGETGSLGLEASQQTRPSSVENDLQPQDSGLKPHILLADDNADMREYVRRLLDPHYSVETVADGRAALEAAQAHTPDLVLTDVMMPQLDGFGLLRALRAGETTAAVPVILLSARAGEEARLEGLQAGADDYMVKPFSARELLARVGTRLELARMRRESTRALRESETRFRHMADNAPVMVWTTEPDGICTYLSRSWYEFTGQTPATGLGFGWLNAVHPDDSERSGEIFRRANERHEPFRLEYRLRRWDGEYRWAIDAAAPRFSDDGVFLGYIGSVIDITERKLAEQGLRENEAKFRTLAEAAPALIWSTDASGGARYLNRRYREFCGKAENELMEDGWQPQIHPDDAPGYIGSFLEAVRDQQPFRQQVRIMRYDGVWRWIDTHALPLFADEGTFLGHVGVSPDVTELVETQQALRANEERLQLLYAQEQAARAEAEAASRLKDEFLATVSHELRTPLTSILGYAQLLQSRQRDAAYIAQTVEKILRSAKAQAQLIEDLLDVSRIVTGKLRIEPRAIEMIPVIQAAVDAVRPAIDAKGIDLDLSLNSAIGHVFGDPNRLQQVVWNLLANAVKFTPHGGAVRVQWQPHNGVAQLMVSDTGKGISAEFLPFVFDRFRQAESTSNRTHDGLGLGLSIVRHLAEMHGGTVEAYSAGPGAGSTFTVSLPLLPGLSATEAGPRNEADLSEAFWPELAGVRVLVVDDQPDILELLRDLLAAYGAVVRISNSASDALATVRAWQPDVLVSDIAMPGDDGYWLIQNVRALPPEQGGATPAAALTAYVRVEDRVRVLAAGFQLYVPKPIDPAELRNAVARLAGAREAADS